MKRTNFANKVYVPERLFDFFNTTTSIKSEFQNFKIQNIYKC